MTNDVAFGWRESAVYITDKNVKLTVLEVRSAAHPNSSKKVYLLVCLDENKQNCVYDIEGNPISGLAKEHGKIMHKLSGSDAYERSK